MQSWVPMGQVLPPWVPQGRHDKSTSTTAALSDQGRYPKFNVVGPKIETMGQSAVAAKCWAPLSFATKQLQRETSFTFANHREGNRGWDFVVDTTDISYIRPGAGVVSSLLSGTYGGHRLACFYDDNPSPCQALLCRLTPIDLCWWPSLTSLFSSLCSPWYWQRPPPSQFIVSVVSSRLYNL